MLSSLINLWGWSYGTKKEPIPPNGAFCVLFFTTGPGTVCFISALGWARYFLAKGDHRNFDLTSDRADPRISIFNRRAAAAEKPLDDYRRQCHCPLSFILPAAEFPISSTAESVCFPPVFTYKSCFLPQIPAPNW